MKDLIIALLGIAVIGMFVTKKELTESWLQVPISTSSEPVAVMMAPSPKGVASAANLADNVVQSRMFSVPPNYQGVLSPRFSNVGYGAHIRYNMPDMNELAVPANALTYGDSMVDPMAAASLPSCPQGVSSENYEPIGGGLSEQAMRIADEGLVKKPNQPNIKVLSASGEVEQPIVYDRMVFANGRSPLQRGGVDRIRGGIPITPITDSWFRPSVRPNIDLVSGAMTIMGGIDNNTHQEMEALKASYRADVPSPYMRSTFPTVAQKEGTLGAARGDVMFSAFP